MSVRSRVVVIGDTHVGSTVGLWPRKFPVEDGGTYAINKFQRWLINCWEVATGEIADLEPDVIIFNGDEIQGTHGDKDGQLITNKSEIQIDAALLLFEPLRQAAPTRYVIRGTAWHTGRAGEYSESMAKQLEATPNPTTERNSWWELFHDMGGPVVNYAHAIGVSSVPYGQATAPLKEVLTLTLELARNYRSRAPRLCGVVRSHRHRCVVAQEPPDLFGATTPGWQLKTEFVYKKANALLPHIGYMVVDWDGERLTPWFRTFDLPGVHVEKLA
jgi:hypothetical protein